MEKVDLKLKSDVHLSRKLTHMVGVLLMAAIHSVLSPFWTWVLLLTSCAVFIPLDFLRQNDAKLNRLTVRIFGPVMRRHEYRKLSGLTFLLLGAVVVLLLFDRSIVTLTLLFLAFGDPIASFVGIRYGRDKIFGRKTLQGSLAAFAVCAIVAWVYYLANNIMAERLLLVSLLSGIIGAVAELVPVGKLDDNFTFPVMSAAMLWVLFQLFGGFSL